MTAATRHAVRAAWVRGLRQVHGWIGLWGAAMGLLFGLTGVVLNHRAQLKLPLPPPVESVQRMPLPDPPPADAQALAAWLRERLSLPDGRARVRVEPGRAAPWDDAVRQPPRWTVQLATPAWNLQAEYWVGSPQVSVRRSEGGLVATLANLHKGTGLGIGWILLADTLAGGVALLSVTGLALWALTARRRTLGLVVASTGAAAMLALALWALAA